MTSHIGLIVAAVLALAAPASAQVDGPATPPAPAPTVGCKPSKRIVCGPDASPALSAAIGRYQQTLGSKRLRRGLGLPSWRRLFGRAGARAQALADARLAGAPKAARTARAAGAPRLRNVGSIGPVKVQATPAPGLGAGVDEVTYTDRIRGPHGSQTRSLRFTATAAACPIAAT